MEEHGGIAVLQEVRGAEGDLEEEQDGEVVALRFFLFKTCFKLMDLDTRHGKNKKKGKKDLRKKKRGGA